MEAVESLNLFRPYYISGLKRLGRRYDGGYVIHLPSLKDSDFLLNYGIGYDISFELDFFRHTGSPTLAFDPTLKDISLITEKLLQGRFIPFIRHLKNYLIWCLIKEESLKKHKISFIQEGISDVNSGEYKTLESHLLEHRLTNKKFILKVDVEGWEYPVFLSEGIYAYLENAVQIILEFHSLDKRLAEAQQIMANLSRTHKLIHIHGNNFAGYFSHHGKNIPETLELTYILNSYVPDGKFSDEKYPVEGLDQPCDKSRQDLKLEFF